MHLIHSLSDVLVPMKEKTLRLTRKYHGGMMKKFNSFKPMV